MLKILPLFLISLFLYGCASTGDKYIQPKHLNDTNSAQIIIYRTDVAYHSLNPEKPFFYLDDKFIGKLGTGDYISFNVAPGEHSLSTKNSILFMPGSENGRVKGQFKSGETYYFRYSKEYVNVVPTGTGFIMSDSTTLQPASKTGFDQRR